MKDFGIICVNVQHLLRDRESEGIYLCFHTPGRNGSGDFVGLSKECALFFATVAEGDSEGKAVRHERSPTDQLRRFYWLDGIAVFIGTQSKRGNKTKQMHLAVIITRE
jgi:hypothetical protein